MLYLTSFKQKLTWLQKWLIFNLARNHKSSSIGLDITAHYLSLVELQKSDNNYELISYAFASLNTPEDKNTAQKVLENVLERVKPKTKNITLALPYSQTHNSVININSHQLQTISIEIFLSLNSENLLGYDINNCYFDYYLTPTKHEDASNTCINVVSTTKEIVDKHVNLFCSTDLKLTVVDINIYALFRAVSWLYPKLIEPYTIVSIDREKVLLGNIKNKQLQLIQETNIPTSYLQNNETIAQYILEQTTLLNITNNTMLICGFNASLELAQNLTKKTQNKIIIANPLEKIIITPHLQQHTKHIQKIAPALMLCCGLALHNLDTPKLVNAPKLNLLPWRETLHQIYKTRLKRTWCSSFVGCILIITIWHITLQQHNSQQLITLQQLQQQLQPLQIRQKKFEAMQQKLYNLQQQKKAIHLIENDQQHNLELLSLLSKTIPPTIQLDLIAKNNNSITIKGRTYSLAALAEFIQKTNHISSPWLNQPSLQEIRSNNNINSAEKSFTLTINNKSSS